MKDILVVSARLIEECRGLELSVMLSVFRYADEEGRCFPHQETIAAYLKTDRGRITKTFTALCRDTEDRPACLSKEKRGRANTYQIAERFLVAPERRPARFGDRSRQHALMLPIAGGAAKCANLARIEMKTGVGSAPVVPPEKVPKRHDIGVKMTPRRGDRESTNPSSTTEPPAARARDDGGLSNSAGPFVRSARPGHDPKRARLSWIGTIGEYLHACRREELGTFWEAAMTAEDPETTAPEIRDYLNRLDQEMRASQWWRVHKQRVPTPRRRAT